jgi:H+/Cl- antiporter ClcA
MHAALFEPGPLFHVPPHRYAELDTAPVFLLVGVACGLLAVVICKGLFIIEEGYRRLPISEFWHPMLGAVVFASIGLAVPEALGVGYGTINDILAGRIAVDTLWVLMLAKLGAWWFALGSGTSGGTLAPILLISGAFGSLLGTLTQHLAPGLHISPGAMALVAMAATFGAATRATFTAIVFAFELTQDYRAIIPIMLATAIADLVAGALLDHRLMTEKLARRGLRVPLAYEPDFLQHAFVGEAMTTDTTEAHDDADASTLNANDTLLHALERMIDEGVEHLPVVDDSSQRIGVCSRTDILRARRALSAMEQERSR